MTPADVVLAMVTVMGDAAGIEPPSPAFSIRVQRSQHSDPGEQQPAATGFRGIYQVLDRDLPALLLLNILRQFHDVVGSLLQRRQPASAAQRYRLIERRRPRHLRSCDALG